MLVIKHKVAESAKISQFLAERANPLNGLYRLLKGSQHLTAGESICRKLDLSGKFRLGSIPKKTDNLSEAAI